MSTLPCQCMNIPQGPKAVAAAPCASTSTGAPAARQATSFGRLYAAWCAFNTQTWSKHIAGNYNYGDGMLFVCVRAMLMRQCDSKHPPGLRLQL